jgi:chromosome segregation ATPase
MTRFLNDKTDRIVELWLEGYSRDLIAKKLRMSGEPVSRRIAQFKRSLSQSAVERLDGLRSLAAELRKSHKTLPEMLSVTRLHNALEDIGVTPENVKHFVTASSKIAETMGIGDESYARVAIRLSQLEATTGKSYNEIIRDFENKTRETIELEKRKEELEAKIKGLNTQKDESDRELKRQLRQNKTTMSNIAAFSTLRDALASNNLSINDVAAIQKLALHIQNCNKSPRVVLARLRQIDNLKTTISTLEEQKCKTQTELHTIEGKVKEAEKQYVGYQAKIRELEDREKELTAKLKTDFGTLKKIEDENAQSNK